MAGKRGGFRPGAGRPETEDKRTLRGLKFSDDEWNTIKDIAEKQGMSARAFLASLVENEKDAEERKDENMENRFLRTEDWMELSELGYWIVDELILDPHYESTACIVKDRGTYYMIQYRGGNPSDVIPVPNYKPSPVYERPEYNHDYMIRGLEPRQGFKPIQVGRAITEKEWDALVAGQALTEDDISDEFEDVYGDIYGPKARTVVIVRQIKCKTAGDNIPLSRELQDKGIQATAPNAGRVNIRVK